MSFLRNLFKSSAKKTEEKVNEQPVALSLDDLFVHNFIDKGGKFIYCLDKESVTKNILNIIEENNWKHIAYKNDSLLEFTSSIDVETHTNLHTKEDPFFTDSEFLIAENGSLLFSENQTSQLRISELTNHFIVFATTSQIVKNSGEGLTGIKVKYPNNIPANISSINSFKIESSEDNFLNYGANNSKNLYLLLLEDF